MLAMDVRHLCGGKGSAIQNKLLAVPPEQRVDLFPWESRLWVGIGLKDRGRARGRARARVKARVKARGRARTRVRARARGQGRCQDQGHKQGRR